MLWLIPLAAAAVAPATGLALWTSGLLTPAMAAHGALMVTAWGLLIPAGGVVARYYKVMPGQDFPRVFDNLAWWRWHRALQYGGIGVASLAAVLMFGVTQGRVSTLHGWCGLATMGLGWLQVLSGWLRGSRGGPTGRGADPDDPATWRGDHYDMTPRRRAFERWHKPAGWAAVALAGVTVLLGAALAGSPGWLLALIGTLQAAATVGLVDGALRGRWVSTYAALWGPDPRHPGNRPAG